MCVYASAGMLYTFHPQTSTEHPIRQFFFPANVNETGNFSAGLGNTFFCLPQRFSPFHENFGIKDFDTLKFSSQKIVNLSGTQHSSFYPESGLLPRAPETPPFLIKIPPKIEKIEKKK